MVSVDGVRSGWRLRFESTWLRCKRLPPGRWGCFAREPPIGLHALLRRSSRCCWWWCPCLCDRWFPVVVAALRCRCRVHAVVVSGRWCLLSRRCCVGWWHGGVVELGSSTWCSWTHRIEHPHRARLSTGSWHGQSGHCPHRWHRGTSSSRHGAAASPSDTRDRGVTAYPNIRVSLMHRFGSCSWRWSSFLFRWWRGLFRHLFDLAVD
mmetsp:Transcript_10067/g.19960  ORF Transcript_10067/g.19960 Transcript_10067/m.19960 type:complete len:207 (+) Transcript_10067:665-1285(+)